MHGNTPRGTKLSSREAEDDQFEGSFADEDEEEAFRRSSAERKIVDQCAVCSHDDGAVHPHSDIEFDPRLELFEVLNLALVFCQAQEMLCRGLITSRSSVDSD